MTVPRKLPAISDLRPFMVTYIHDGRPWAVQIFAKDIEDARRKTRAIGMTGQPGEVMAQFESRAPTGLFWPLLSLHAFLLNAWMRFKKAIGK